MKGKKSSVNKDMFDLSASASCKGRSEEESAEISRMKLPGIR